MRGTLQGLINDIRGGCKYVCRNGDVSGKGIKIMFFMPKVFRDRRVCVFKEHVSIGFWVGMITKTLNIEFRVFGNENLFH